jgi:hypothetical protein
MAKDAAAEAQKAKEKKEKTKRRAENFNARAGQKDIRAKERFHEGEYKQAKRDMEKRVKKESKGKKSKILKELGF